MTGYGLAVGDYQNKKISVEIRSLNGKSTDVRMKVPSNYRDRELVLRRAVIAGALRGKLEMVVTIDSEDGHDEYGLNIPLFKKYHKEISSLSDELNLDQSAILTSILRIQNVIKAQDDSLDDEEWTLVQDLTKKAIDDLNNFRNVEGEAMKTDLLERVANIVTNLKGVSKYERNRLERLKSRLQQNINEHLGSEKLDRNRLEQEMIYYIEKLDINEEKVRLQQHCDYFTEALIIAEPEKGRRLNFISQEIGREINTLGAKAQDSEIQQLVVSMKDELEKIKEQVANVV